MGQSAFPIPEEVQVTSHGGSPLDLEGPSGDPIVALLDGLPLENHDFLNGRLTVDDPDGWAAETPAADRHHGTNMASLLLGVIWTTVKFRLTALFTFGP